MRFFLFLLIFFSFSLSAEKIFLGEESESRGEPKEEKISCNLFFLHEPLNTPSDILFTSGFKELPKQLFSLSQRYYCRLTDDTSNDLKTTSPLLYKLSKESYKENLFLNEESFEIDTPPTSKKEMEENLKRMVFSEGNEFGNNVWIRLKKGVLIDVHICYGLDLKMKKCKR